MTAGVHPNDRPMASTRDRIVTAAERLYLTGGLHAVTMRKVAHQLGISATALYRHVRNRDALIDALAERGFGVFIGYLRRRARGDPLRVLWDNYLAFALDHPRLYALIFVEHRRRPRRFPDDFAAHASASFDVLHDVVREEMRRGRLASDNSLEVALGLWAHIHGLVSLHQAGRFSDERSFRRVYFRAIDRHLDGLRSPPTRAEPAPHRRRATLDKKEP